MGLAMQQPQPSPALASAVETMDDLAMEIYVRLVSGKYLDPNYVRSPDESNLRQWARDAQAAAAAYYQTLQETNSNG